MGNILILLLKWSGLLGSLVAAWSGVAPYVSTGLATASNAVTAVSAGLAAVGLIAHKVDDFIQANKG